MQKPLDVAAVLARVRDACRAQPAGRAPRRARPSDPDAVVTTSVNVPFPNLIDAATLGRALRDNEVPPGFAGHLERFLGELPLDDILAFCDRHGIAPARLARFVRSRRQELSVFRPELEAHLDAFVPRS